MFTAVLFDIDGTLVDSNDAHAHAWVKAFEEGGIEADSALGRRISERRGEIYEGPWDLLAQLDRSPIVN